MDDEHKKMYKMHHKSKTFMINAITLKGFDKCTDKETTNNIYENLVMTYEGNKQVQGANVNHLVRKYELLKMEEDQDIEIIFSKFQTLILGLKVLEKNYTIVDHAKKILRSLPSKWRPKITIIQEAKDFNTLKLEELISSLKSHEIELAEDEP
ncbi:uncharacterized protein [Cicer arietinum]|uniref:uncharacterized protein n=1 Tax=Cicer arietinum TaxID=3827 RepID=UPI003CC585D2